MRKKVSVGILRIPQYHYQDEGLHKNFNKSKSPKLGKVAMNGHLLSEPLLHQLNGTHARTFSANHVLDPLRKPIKTLICSYQTL